MTLVAGCTVSPPPAPQSTDTSKITEAPPPRATQIIMAIDSIGPGFNSHLLSDQSPVNAAISSLVLPSSFRPVPDPASPTGSRWELDPTLLESAAVTNENPFTVTYKIRPERSGRTTPRSAPTTSGICGARWSATRVSWILPATT